MSEDSLLFGKQGLCGMPATVHVPSTVVVADFGVRTVGAGRTEQGPEFVNPARRELLSQ